jgi:hypothetical protein
MTSVVEEQLGVKSELRYLSLYIELGKLRSGYD